MVVFCFWFFFSWFKLSFLRRAFPQRAALSSKVKELDTARAASEDLILSLSAEKSRMLGSSGEADETIDSLVDEYSRLVSPPPPVLTPGLVFHYRPYALGEIQLLI